MPPGLSGALGDPKPLENNRILTLETDGFSIGSDHAVNENGFPYYWVAMKTGTGRVDIGQYLGDGSSYHPITGLEFRPAAVIVISDENQLAVVRTETMAAGSSYPLNDDLPVLGGILDFTDTGFDVGFSSAVNGAGITMYYVAWSAAAGEVSTGSYLGDGSDGRVVPDVGFAPEYLIVRGTWDRRGVQRMASVGGDSTLFFQNLDVSENIIQSFTTDGFVVGSDVNINDAGVNFNWLALANPSIPPLSSDLRLQMGADNAAPNVGEVVTFGLTLSNLGPADAAGVTVKAVLPAGLAYQSSSGDQGTYDPGTGTWTVGTVPVGPDIKFEIQATVAPGTGGTTLNLDAMATAASPAEDNPGDNEVAVAITVPSTDLVLISLVSDASPNVGGTVVYTVAVTNAGPDEGTGIAVSGSLPAGLSFLTASPSTGTYDNLTGTWTLGALAAARTATLTMLARVEPGSGGQTLEVPFAITTLDQEDPTAANNTGTATITVTSSDLGLKKTVDIASPDEGATVTFTIVATNDGPNRATGVRVSDVLPAGLSFDSAAADSGVYDPGTGLWDIGTLASGATANLDLVATVAVGTGGQTLANTASMAGVDQEDPDPGNDTATAKVLVSSTDLQVGKAVDRASPNEGETVLFTITVANAGPTAATGVALTDTLPTGLTFLGAVPSNGSYDSGSGTWTLGGLAGGATDSLEVSAQVDAGTAGATLVNRAWISASDLADPVAANDTSSVAVTVASTDLQVTKDVDNIAPNEGDPVVYTVTLGNSGPNDATGVQVTDLLPAGVTLAGSTPSQGTYEDVSGLWNVGLLTNGATATLTLNATVDTGTAGSVITNTAAITTASLADPEPANNTASATLTVSSTDLQVSKIVDEATPSVGGTIVYTISLDNVGPNIATGVVLQDVLPGGLTLKTITASQGFYDPADGLWTVGTVPVGNTALLILTATVDASAAGRNIINEASIVTVDQADLDAANNVAAAAIDVPEEVVTPVVSVQTIPGTVAEVMPGDDPRPVLRFTLANLGDRADTLRSLTVTNLTVGLGGPSQAELDAEWAPLTVYGQVRGLSGIGPERALPATAFSAGRASMSGFDWIIDPGDTLEVRVESAPSLAARDKALLVAGVTSAADLGVRQTVVVEGGLPLRSGHDQFVDGFVADQAAIINVPSGTVAAGTVRNLVMAVDLPANGYLKDSLYGLTIVNRGTATAADIAAMEAWSDDGDGVFDAAVDTLLGEVINSGQLWQLSGLKAPITSGGRRFFISVDIAAKATPANDIRLELPVGLGSAVIMASGNDGPLDRRLVNGGVLAISIADRLMLSTEDIDPGTVRPDAGIIPLLTVNLANTYTTEKLLQSLTVRNATLTDPAATIDDRDGIIRQVVLRLDGNGNGLIEDYETDPALGSGAFKGDLITFTGLDLPLTPGGLERIFVTADVDPGAVADGDILGAAIDGESAVWAPGTVLVASWPLDSGAAWRVDGMIAAQVVSNSVPGRTLGPGDGPELALDLLVPANGYLADVLVGLGLTNAGTAVPGDLAQVRLWADDDDGMFSSATDSLLGNMNYLNGHWLSPVLNKDVPVGGVRLFVSVDAAAVPTDSATVRLTVPQDGIVMGSDNSGPYDAAVPPGGTLVLSTSALASQTDFTSTATTIGLTGTLRMTVRNVGLENVMGILPTMLIGEGDAAITLGAPSPPTMDLLPEEAGEFVWTYTATEPGTITVIGAASGTGFDTGIDHASAPSTSAALRVHTPVPGLDAYPTTNLPTSVARGQQGLVPLTVTLVNPGDQDVAVARLDSFRIRLAETADGPPITPAELITRVTLSEGSNVYFDESSLPAVGDEIVLRLSPPVLVNGSEPATLSLSLSLRSDSTVPSFLMSIDGSDDFHAVDQVSSLPVAVALGSGTFPIATKKANLVSPAGLLDVTCAADLETTAQPGQANVNIATLNLANDTDDPTASAVRIQALGCVVRDSLGAVVADPAALFDAVRVTTPSQTLFAGPPQYQDSLMVMLLGLPVEVPVGANVALELTGDLASDAPPGAFRFDFTDRGQWLAEDAGDGGPVAVTIMPATPVAGLTVYAPTPALWVQGDGMLPAVINPGARDVAVMQLALVHPGADETTAASWDSLALQLVDASRDPLDPSGLLDRVRVLANGVAVGNLIDPAAADGVMTIALAAPPLAPGDTLVCDVHLDLRTDAPLTSLELFAAVEGIVTRDTISGERPALTTIGTWPVWSGLTAIIVPAEEMLLGGSNLMPPLLVPRSAPEPVLNLTLANPAAAGSGPLTVTSVTLAPAATDNDFAAPGAVVAIVAAAESGVELGRNAAVDPAATALTVVFTDPLVLAAGETREIELMVGIREGAPAGRLRLAVDADGIVAGPQGGPTGGIRILGAAGQALPVVTDIGNIGQASLQDSYINFPNPFAAGREHTTFAYHLSGTARVSLRLLTPHGENVVTLLDASERGAGLHQDTVWNGLNGRGLAVRNGVYIAEIVVEYSDGTRDRVLRKVAVKR